MKWAISKFWLPLALLVPAAFLRFYQLSIKPIHFDEGINGFFVQQMWLKGFYDYNPENFHGPLLFYIFQWAEIAFGPGVAPMRAMMSVAGMVCIALIFHFQTENFERPRWPHWLAAFLVAVSPGFVFCSRYAIHESLFIVGEILFLSGALKYFVWPNKNSIWMLSLGLVVMLSSKETTIVFLGVLAIAVGCLWISQRIRPGSWGPKRGQESQQVGPSENDSQILKQHWWAAVLFTVFSTVMLFSGFARDWASLPDFFSTYMFWTKTGLGQTGHEKPFIYWLELMWRYEPAFLLILTLTPLFLFSRNLMLRFMAIVSLGFFLAYSVIPYKTPWLILNILFPLALLIILALKELRGWRRWVTGFFVFFFALFSIPRTWSLNFSEFANAQEPYVYVQSTKDLTSFQNRLDQMANENPEQLNIKLRILLKDPWPLPFVFARWPKAQFSNVETYVVEAQTSGAADIIVIESSDQNALEVSLQEPYWRWEFALREAKEKCIAYWRKSRFSIAPFADAEIVGERGDHR